MYVLNLLFNGASYVRDGFNSVVYMARLANEDCLALWYCKPFKKFLLHNVVYSIYKFIVSIFNSVFNFLRYLFVTAYTSFIYVASAIYNSISFLILGTYNVLYYVVYVTCLAALHSINFAYNSIITVFIMINNKCLDVFSYIYNLPECFRSLDYKDILYKDINISRPALSTVEKEPGRLFEYLKEKLLFQPSHDILCYITPSHRKCMSALTYVPANCFMYKVIRVSYTNMAGMAKDQLDYALTKVVMPAGGIFFPITYVDPELTPLAYIIDLVLEKVFPSTKMTICSIQPHPVTRTQYFIDLLIRAAQFTQPSVAYKMNATVQCIQTKTGERNYVETLSYLMIIFFACVLFYGIHKWFFRPVLTEIYLGDTYKEQQTGQRNTEDQVMNGGQVSGVQATEGQATDDQATDDQATDDQATEDQATEDRATENQATEDQATEDQATEDQATEDQATEDQATEDQATEDQVAEDQAAGDQTTKDQNTPSPASGTLSLSDISSEKDVDEDDSDGGKPTRDNIRAEKSTGEQSTPTATDDQIASDQETEDPSNNQIAIDTQAITNEQAIPGKNTTGKKSPVPIGIGIKATSEGSGKKSPLQVVFGKNIGPSKTTTEQATVVFSSSRHPDLEAVPKKIIDDNELKGFFSGGLSRDKLLKSKASVQMSARTEEITNDNVLKRLFERKASRVEILKPKDLVQMSAHAKKIIDPSQEDTPLDSIFDPLDQFVKEAPLEQRAEKEHSKEQAEETTLEAAGSDTHMEKSVSE